jgi:hypothetical protein
MLIVTIAALLMAASLAWFAYRLLQEEHRRSEARVAVLTAALDAEPATQAWSVARAPAHRSTSGSAPHAATPDIVLLEDDSRNMRAFVSERDTPHRSVTALADPADKLREPLIDRGALRSEPESGATNVATRGVGLFAEVPEARQGDARGLLAVAAVALVGLLIAGYAMFGRGTATATHAPATPPATTPALGQAHPAGVPLELVALTHTQQRDALVVRGRVRNPAAGSDRQVVAHVALLDAEGVVIGEADGALAIDRLRAGREAPFEARLAVTPAMRRYRVTFRDAGGIQVAHLDRRATAR